MGVVPPFGWRDVETLEDGVAYISNLWVLAGPLYTLCVQSVHKSSLVEDELSGVLFSMRPLISLTPHRPCSPFHLCRSTRLLFCETYFVLPRGTGDGH